MKRLIIIIPVFYFTISFGQTADKEPDQIDFDLAINTYYDEELDSALVLFQKFLLNHPDSPLVPKVKYNIGYILREVGKDEESIPVFEEILASDYNDREKFGGLMEQYALYKHRSASHLAEIYLDAGDYEKAKKYIKLFDKKYKYKHFCGNELKANQIYTAIIYARLYNGEGKRQKAIKTLLPFIFDSGYASNLELLDLLNNLLREQYSVEEIRILVKDAKASLKETNKDVAQINFLGTRIKVYDHQLFAIGNLEYEKNLDLKGMEKWEKVFDTNPLFEKYVN